MLNLEIVGSYITPFVFPLTVREFLEKLQKSQSGRPHPSKEFRKDPKMRLYKIFDKIQRKSALPQFNVLVC